MVARLPCNLKLFFFGCLRICDPLFRDHWRSAFRHRPSTVMWSIFNFASCLIPAHFLLLVSASYLSSSYLLASFLVLKYSTLGELAPANKIILRFYKNVRWLNTYFNSFRLSSGRWYPLTVSWGIQIGALAETQPNSWFRKAYVPQNKQACHTKGLYLTSQSSLTLSDHQILFSRYICVLSGRYITYVPVSEVHSTYDTLVMFETKLQVSTESSSRVRWVIKNLFCT